METDFSADIGAMSRELKNFTADATEKIEHLDYINKENNARLVSVEQHLSRPTSGIGIGSTFDIGSAIVNSNGFKDLANGAPRSGRIDVQSFSNFSEKTLIANATGQNQPLVPSFRVPGITTLAERRLTVRDLIPTIPTTSNMIEFPRETAVTNNAQYQAAEGDTKGESAINYQLATAPVATMAHWIPISRQLLDDAPAFQAYVNSRLTFLLKIKEENELIFGTGATGHLNGLATQATVMSTANASTATDSYIDTVGEALAQLEDSDYEADGIIMNRRDWWSIRKSKTSGGGADGRYLVGDPLQDLQPTLWGVPVVPTNSMTRGQFIVGAFRTACSIYDRMQARVEVSREHADYFVRNLAAVLCEERLSLVVYQPAAILWCGLPFGS